ncbi:MAG: secretin N-terminal domain-containing protein [Candidatus Omnitrophota bacterium]
MRNKLAIYLLLVLIFLLAKVPKLLPQVVDKSLMVSRELDTWEREQSVPYAGVTPKAVPEVPKIIVDSLELKDMDIMDVLKLLSQKTGLNIVAGKNVRGKITLYLKNVDVRDVLRIILETNELAFEEDGNIIKVMTARDYELLFGKKFGDKTKVKVVPLKYATAADLVPLLNQIKSQIGKVLVDEQSNTVVMMDTETLLAEMQNLIKEVDVPVVTRVFALSYTKAEDLEKKLAGVLSKNVGQIRVDARSNKVYVTDIPSKMLEVESIINAFDEKHRQVLIEAKIVKVELGDEFKMGVDWEAILRAYHDMDFKSAFTVLTSTDKKGRFSIGSIASDDYTAVVEALEHVGKTNTLSSPRITALNNEEAKILVGSTEPYVTTTTTTPASGPTTTAESVNFIDVGVKLFVTPTINEESFITMKIRPEVSSVDNYLTTSQNNKIPIVTTTTAETTVMVKDGVTIVIGGLIKDEVIDTVNKVPIMGDLPLLGFLFRNRDKKITKSELVVFLTPHIVTGDYNSYQPPDSQEVAIVEE